MTFKNSRDNFQGGEDHTCTARLSYFHKHSRDHVGGMFRLSFLRPLHSQPEPKTYPGEKTYWGASNQPLWLVPRPYKDTTEWMLVVRIHSECKTDETKPYSTAQRVGEVSVSGRYFKKAWRFMDVYVRRKHVERMVEIAGPEFLDCLHPRRMPAAARLVIPIGVWQFGATEYWALLNPERELL